MPEQCGDYRRSVGDSTVHDRNRYYSIGRGFGLCVCSPHTGLEGLSPGAIELSDLGTAGDVEAAGQGDRDRALANHQRGSRSDEREVDDDCELSKHIVAACC